MKALTLKTTGLLQAQSLAARLRACVRALVAMRVQGQEAFGLGTSRPYPMVSGVSRHCAFIGLGLPTLNSQSGNKPWSQATRVPLPRGGFA